MNFERLRVKPAEFHPRWWHRPATLLLILLGWWMTTDGIRMLIEGHWWGVYAFIIGPKVILLMRYDVALQRASERDRAIERDQRITELEDELGIEKR